MSITGAAGGCALGLTPSMAFKFEAGDGVTPSMAFNSVAFAALLGCAGASPFFFFPVI